MFKYIKISVFLKFCVNFFEQFEETFLRLNEWTNKMNNYHIQLIELNMRVIEPSCI